VQFFNIHLKIITFAKLYLSEKIDTGMKHPFLEKHKHNSYKINNMGVPTYHL